MIYIDVDGTLIDENDRPRVEMVAVVWSMLNDGRESIAIWSGGGAEYADLWAQRLFYGQGLMALAKDSRLPFAGDTVVDDSLEFAVPPGVRLFTPEDFAFWGRFE